MRFLARGRDVDGSYLVYRHGKQNGCARRVSSTASGTKDLAVDVAEAQIRLYRREECLVESHVWDLYGDCDGTLTEKLSLNYGTGCCSTYVRINLRAMGWQDFLARAPPALWPLVALTRDGATGAAVEKARDAIEARTDRTSSERADHLAVLWFVAEAEDVAVHLLRAYLQKRRLMESTLYKSIFAEGELAGEARGEVRAYTETITQVLIRWLGTLDVAFRQHLAAFSDRAILRAWQQEAIYLHGADDARKLIEKIEATPLPPPAPTRGTSS
ncbi:MAG: hypothetical protein IPM54_13345 [Polyangiaceae bacterium]|nr:hypothetical protein [Polyangiaceae bacterium]